MEYSKSCFSKTIKSLNESLGNCQIVVTQACLVILFMVFPITTMSLVADELFDSAMDEFMNDNLTQAASLFESAIAQGNTDADAFLYLSYCYQNMELYDQAIAALERGLGYSRDKRYLYYYNMGTLYSQKEESEEALERYSLAISSRASFPDAYLNRANTYLKEWELSSALSDYQSFLRIAPDHALAPDVRRMIAAIQAEVAAEDARQAEQERIAQEQESARQQAELDAQRQAQEEEERRAALLNDILGNLNQASDEANTVGAGTEEISHEEDDFERAD